MRRRINRIPTSDQDNYQSNHQGGHQNSRQRNHPHRRYGRERKEATVVIPNCNGLSFTEPCFKALEFQICRDLEVLVMNNGSMDGSVEWLRDQGVASVFLDNDTGFSGAVNRGIRATSTPYVIPLSNNTESGCHYVGGMIGTIECPPRIFSVSNEAIQTYHKELMDDTGDMCSLLDWAFQRGVGHSPAGHDKTYRIFSACAGTAIYRRKIFDEIGYSGRTHLAHLEDADAGYGARIAGYDNIYCPSAVVYHVGSSTSDSKYNSLKVKLVARNNVYLNYKNMPASQLAVNLLPIIVGITVKYMFSRKVGFAKDYVEGLKGGTATAGTCRKAPYGPRYLHNYFAIEWELLTGTLIYLYESTARQTAKL